MYVFAERNQIKNISVHITVSFIFQFHKTLILLLWLTSKEETCLKLAIKNWINVWIYSNSIAKAFLE